MCLLLSSNIVTGLKRPGVEGMESSNQRYNGVQFLCSQQQAFQQTEWLLACNRVIYVCRHCPSASTPGADQCMNKLVDRTQLKDIVSIVAYSCC